MYSERPISSVSPLTCSLAINFCSADTERQKDSTSWSEMASSPKCPPPPPWPPWPSAEKPITERRVLSPDSATTRVDIELMRRLMVDWMRDTCELIDYYEGAKRKVSQLLG